MMGGMGGGAPGLPGAGGQPGEPGEPPASMESLLQVSYNFTAKVSNDKKVLFDVCCCSGGSAAGSADAGQ